MTLMSDEHESIKNLSKEQVISLDELARFLMLDTEVYNYQNRTRLNDQTHCEVFKTKHIKLRFVIMDDIQKEFKKRKLYALAEFGEPVFEIETGMLRFEYFMMIFKACITYCKQEIKNFREFSL